MKRNMLAVLAVFAAWSVMDFVLHGIILAADYAASPLLWRPMKEMKMLLMYTVVLVSAAAFVAIYAWLIPDKSVKRGVQYGLLYGIGTGISMGYGSYSVMPLPYHMAVGWFAGSVVEAMVAGWIIGVMVKKSV